MRSGYDKGLELLRTLDDEVGEWEMLDDNDVRIVELRKLFGVKEEEKKDRKRGSEPRYRLRCESIKTGEIVVHETVKDFCKVNAIHQNNVYSALSTGRNCKGWRLEKQWK